MKKGTEVEVRPPPSSAVEIPAPSRAELQAHMAEPKRRADWGRRLSALITGFASVFFMILAAIVTWQVLSGKSPLSLLVASLPLLTLYGMAFCCGILTRRFLRDRGISSDIELTTAEREAFNALRSPTKVPAQRPHQASAGQDSVPSQAELVPKAGAHHETNDA